MQSKHKFVSPCYTVDMLAFFTIAFANTVYC